MGNEIKVNAGRGSVSFGNVVQGNHNQVGNMVSTATIELALNRARAEVSRLAPPGSDGAAAAAKVAQHLEEFGAEARQPNPSEEKGSKILKAIRDNFSWAYPAIKDLAAAVWPALLSML